jgi:hypothetical protein
VLDDEHAVDNKNVAVNTVVGEANVLDNSNARTGKADASNVERFEYQFRHLIEAMVEWSRAQPVKEYLRRKPKDQPVHPTALNLLLKSDPTVLSDTLLECVPLKVKDILGRPDLRIDHLELLPKSGSEKAGCYLALSVKKLASNQGDVPYFTSFLGESCEVGAYVGSSCRKMGGMRDRWAQHQSEIKRALRGRSQAPKSFYRFAGRSGIKTTFAPLALIDQGKPRSKAQSLFLEGVFQAYLRLIQDADKDHDYHNSLVTPFIDSIRSNGMPDFKSHGLNRAWSIKQGGLGGSTSKECGKSGCSRKHDSFLMTPGDFLGDRLCSMHGRERIRQTQSFLAGGPCVRCSKPRGYMKVNFSGSGDSSTCYSCRNRISKLKRKGKPIPTVEEDAANYCGCANCGRAEWSGPPRILQFIGLGKDRRCDACFYYRAGNDGNERPRDEWYAVLCLKSSAKLLTWISRDNNPVPQGMDGCKNPHCGLPESAPAGQPFHGVGIYRRCRNCRQTIRQYGRERIPDPVNFPMAPEMKTGCGNCGAPEPPEGSKKVYCGRGKARRCPKCYNWSLINGGKERPPHLWDSSKEKPPREINLKGKDGCKNCGEPENGGKTFSGLGEERRCMTCYDFRRKNGGQERPPRLWQNNK